MLHRKRTATTATEFLLDWLQTFCKVAAVVLALALPSINAAWADAHAPAPHQPTVTHMDVLDCTGNCR